MGRPRQPAAQPDPAAPRAAFTGAPSRRGFFQRSGGLALAAAAAPWVPLAPASAAGPVFQHGVASGDPASDGVLLWTRVSPATARTLLPVQWQLALDPGFNQLVASGSVATSAARDHTVKVEVTGLQPAQSYFYRFQAEGALSPVGRTRTLPLGAVERLRIAVASCSNHAAGYFNAYRRIAERSDLDLVVHLGDYLYEYGEGQYGNLRPTEPAHEILTLADYRARHAQYKRDADLQELHRQHPMVAIWDDHEVANDAWRQGAQNHDQASEGPWLQRRSQALQAYHEWMPVREGSAPTRNQRSFRLGDLAELVMLEERHGARSKQLPAPIPVPGLGQGFVALGPYLDPDRTLLGAEQEAWLASTLRGSPARWKIIGQGVMLAQLKALGRPNAAGGGLFVNPDQWDGYPMARERLFDVLAGADGQPAVPNVVVLTGDIHSAWAADLARDPNNPDPAQGGYDPGSGAGSLAVEFVTTSITSPGLVDDGGQLTALAASQNPHFKHIDLNRRGYLLLDVSPERVVGEFWAVDTVAAPSHIETLTAAFEVQHGSNRITPAVPTAPRRRASRLAPR